MLTTEKVLALATSASNWSTMNAFLTVERTKDSLLVEDVTVTMDSPDMTEKTASEPALNTHGGIHTKTNANASGDTK